MRRSPSVYRLLRPALALVLAAGIAPARADDGKAPPAPADDAETRGYVGFGASPVGALEDADRKELGAPDGSVVVTGVTPGMPGEAAGLRRGDVLVAVDGKPVPDASGITRETEGTFSKWQEAWKALFAGVKPGTKVVFELKRAGQPVTVEAVAVDFETRRRLEETAVEEEAARAPDPAAAGEPKAATFTFEDVETERPEGFLTYQGGVWEVRSEQETTKENMVLLQDSSVEPWTTCLVTGPGRALADGKVSVRWKPLSGSQDQTGGIVFRAQDRRTYYLARANALEGNLRIYVMRKDERTQIASAEVKPPATGAWHTLEVSFAGPKLTATLDGKDTVSVDDSTFARGWTGLWTKADAVVEFDDLKIEPAAAPAPPK